MTRTQFRLAMALFSIGVLGSLMALFYVDPASATLAGFIGLPALLGAWVIGDQP